MLLRPEFSRMRRLAVHRRAAFHGVGKILVSMGGTDPKNFTGLVLDGLSGIQWGSSVPKVEVVLSRAAPFLSDVRQRAHLHELDVEVSLDVTDMAQRMLESDLAIGASGSTSWERCCLGLPSIVLTTADNQRFVAKSLLNAGVALGSTNGGISVAEVGRLLARLCESPPLWKEMSHKAFMVTDGMGASRVVQEMYPMKAKDGQAVYLRPVTFDDVEPLYQWQSNPQTRRYSNNKSVPQFHEHVAWLRDRLKSVSSLTQMIMHGDEPSGVIRLDPTTDENHDEFIISIYVSPSKYKLGLGRASLKMLCEMMDGCLLLAQVHEENDASHALFVSSGFEKISATYYSKQF
jgi:RimJ/RimL family protein N-acetyltransferase